MKKAWESLSQSTQRWIKFALKLLITVGVILLISRKLEWAKTWEMLRTMNLGWFLAGVSVFAFSKYLGAQRVQCFWRTLGLRLSHGFNNRLYVLSMFYNLVLPGGIGGDGYKVYFLNKRKGTKIKFLASAVLLDRANGLAILVVMALGLSYFLVLPENLNTWLWMLIPGVPLGYWGVLKLVFPTFLPGWWRPFIWSVGVQGGQALTALCLLWALGIEANELAYIFVLVISAIVLVVPLPSFGGLGLREWVVLYGANHLGLDSEVSVAMSLAMYLIIVMVSLSGVYFHFNDKGLKEENP